MLALAASPDGALLVSGSADKTARIFRLSDGSVDRVLASHSGPVQSVAFSPSGDRLATAGGDGGVKIWKSSSWQGVIAFAHNDVKANSPPSAIHQAVFLDERSLATGAADKTIKLWRYEGDWSEAVRLDGHVFRVLALDFSPDGALLATGGGEPSRSGEVKVWMLPKLALVRSFDALHSDTVLGLRFSPDGSLLASAGADKFVKVARLSDGQAIRILEGHTGHVLGVDWKPDAKQLVSSGSDNVVKLWDAASGDQIRTFQNAGKAVTGVSWLPGGPNVVGVSGDKLGRLWNADNGGVQANYSGASDYLLCVAMSPSGARIAAGSADGSIIVWRRDNAQILRKIDPPVQADAAATAK